MNWNTAWKLISIKGFNITVKKKFFLLESLFSWLNTDTKAGVEFEYYSYEFIY
jgi:hypothetical protein